MEASKLINQELMDFINKTPNAFSCVENLKEDLLKQGYEQLYENESWDTLKKNGKYFVIRNDSSLIAFQLTSKRSNSFNVAIAHSDSPSFMIKPNPEMAGNYLKLNTMPYGDMLNYSWLDRPLSMAGRITYRNKNSNLIETKTINFDKNLFVIPSEALHVKRDANDKLSLNRQTDMLPVIALNDTYGFEQIVGLELAKEGIDVSNIDNMDYDLYLYNPDKVQYVGYQNEMIIGPRMDDLACLYPSYRSFINSSNDNSINVFCAYNNEDIGSLTYQGADSTFLIDTLTRIAKTTDMDLLTSLSNTMIVSADNAHAIHPASPQKSDPTNQVHLNKGVVIKHHIRYTTDGLSSFIFKDICHQAQVPYQDFACRSDMLSGTTLGGINQSHVGALSVDIGVPQLAMHSANETIGSADIWYMYQALQAYYESTLIREKDKVRLLHK